MEILEKDKQRTTTVVAALKHTAFEKRLRELELFHMKNRISGGSYKCLQIPYESW